MEIQIIQSKMVPKEVDINCQISERLGDWAVTTYKSDMTFFQLIKRWKFYYPVHPNYRGNFDELKLLTCPGEGYVSDQPWCSFDTDSTFHLNMFLDIYPYI